MKDDIPIKNGIVIPASELEITTSRSGGPGGQHVNKTNTRVTVRWNVKTSSAFNDEQRERIMRYLQAELTTEGDLMVHTSTSRSQKQNKQIAYANLAEKIRKALYIPKKRIATRSSKTSKKARLDAKIRHSAIKKMRSKVIRYD